MTSEERKQKVLELRSNWDQIFQQLGLEDLAYYYPKPIIKIGNEDFMYIFPTELSNRKDIYTEVVDYSLVPVGTRKLLRLRYNEFHVEEFELIDTKIGKQYKIPFAELEEVKVMIPKVPIATREDLAADSLTARDWACIHLRVPDSDKPWLNQLIQKAIK